MLGKKDGAAVLTAQLRRYRATGLGCSSGAGARGGAAPGGVLRGVGATAADAGAAGAAGVLADTACLFRRDTAAARRLSEVWWQELSAFSVRDQVSFPYAAWAAGAAVHWWPGVIRDGGALSLPPSPFFRNLYHSNVQYGGGTVRHAPLAVGVGYDAAGAKAEVEQMESEESFE